jgi:DNA-binding response OmpR family regulator
LTISIHLGRSDLLTAAEPPNAFPEAKILFVDDDIQVRRTLARLLGLLGYQVDEASSGQQALQMLEQSVYDVAVLDIRMPGMDGVEVMHHARQICPDLAIIFLTGHATVDSAVAAVRSHAVDYLLKPVSNRDLAAAVSQALQQRPQREPLKVSCTSEQFLEVGCVTLDRKRRAVIVTGAEHTVELSNRLTNSEVALLSCLMQRPGVAVSCRQLAQDALDYHVNEEEASTIIRPHISRLRKKIEFDPDQPRLILTVRGRRYLFNSQPVLPPKT